MCSDIWMLILFANAIFSIHCLTDIIRAGSELLLVEIRDILAFFIKAPHTVFLTHHYCGIRPLLCLTVIRSDHSNLCIRTVLNDPGQHNIPGTAECIRRRIIYCSNRETPGIVDSELEQDIIGILWN